MKFTQGSSVRLRLENMASASTWMRKSVHGARARIQGSLLRGEEGRGAQ